MSTAKRTTFCYSELCQQTSEPEWRIFGYDIEGGRVYVNFYCGLRVRRKVLPCFFPDNFVFNKNADDYGNNFLRNLEARIRGKMREYQEPEKRKNVISYLIEVETCEG